ncbi:DNA-binding transcriptional regulator, CsgD family [Altererythrobacter xiamenensis]|uniref:DNA-binding transcriptional regulator, CsgD family n=1 Tax=Altererythrobacter xiamenensis TaxID=1316679 RepID=A0A1Y6ESY3_9SPHN|nr:helix-turn-helix transcriptional regulator [Altererythrobacter xiamenensis]SMQ63283.1 DNA-binding transcriptional regulator, CsgD family [Altererythrobacter xiamenensis]
MEIIGQIYEALDDDEAQEVLPDHLAGALRGRSCTIQTFSPQFELEEMWLNHFSAAMDDYYRLHSLHRHDAWTKTNLTRIGLNRSAKHSDFVEISEFRNSFFFNEFIRQFGDDSGQCMGFISKRSDDGLVVLGIQKAYIEDDFSDDELGLLELLRPHITRMAVLRRNLNRHKEQASGAILGINEIEDAYLVLAADRRISFANAEAEALLNHPSLLRSSQGRLFLHRPQDDQKLAAALNDANHNHRSGRLSYLGQDSTGTTWRFTLAPKKFEGETKVLVWIDRCKASASAPIAMQQIYGLTEAELPILMAVSQGYSAAEISDQHQISIATVRTHIQHIYQKTGVQKASQLAQLVASLPRIRQPEG